MPDFSSKRLHWVASRVFNFCEPNLLKKCWQILIDFSFRTALPLVRISFFSDGLIGPLLAGEIHALFSVAFFSALIVV